jgi:hypothetical protein
MAAIKSKESTAQLWHGHALAREEGAGCSLHLRASGPELTRLLRGLAVESVSQLPGREPPCDSSKTMAVLASSRISATRHPRLTKTLCEYRLMIPLAVMRTCAAAAAYDAHVRSFGALPFSHAIDACSLCKEQAQLRCI